MSRVFGATIALAVLLSVPTAEASRRSSLAGNLLFEDVKDIFALPHEIVQYVNHVWFDFLPSAIAAGAFEGSGGILFGNAVQRNFGVGIATHRSDYQGAILDHGGLGDLLTLGRVNGIEDGEALFDSVGDQALAAPDTLNWVDLLVGFEAAPGIYAGARLSVGANLTASEDLDGDDSGLANPGSSANSINLVLSAGTGGEDDPMTIDGSLEISSASYAAESLVSDTEEINDEGSTLGIALAGRAFLEMSESIDLGIVGFFSTRSRSTSLDDPNDVRTDMDVSEMNLGAGVGPRYHINDDATVAAYATLGFGQRTADPEGTDNLNDRVTIILPRINIAAEWFLTEWFIYRAGLMSQYVLTSVEQQEDSDRAGQTDSGRQLDFYWSNGIGLVALDGDFHFDAVLEWPVITNGPGLFSAQPQALFGMVTVSYTF